MNSRYKSGAIARNSGLDTSF